MIYASSRIPRASGHRTPLVVVASLLLILLLVIVDSAEALSFTCFLEKTETDCQRNGGMYCMWTPNGKNGGKCDLSPFSLTMLCLYDKVPSLCDQAKRDCVRFNTQHGCELQGVCEWTQDGTCVAGHRDLSFEDMLTPPPTSSADPGTSQDEKTPPPTTSDVNNPSNPKRAECCKLSASLCARRSDRSSDGFNELLQKTKNTCGMKSLHRICKMSKKRCAARL